MKITPIDIAHKTFTKRMLGIDADEVYQFLQQVAGAMEALTLERNSLKEILREKELSLLEYKERDQVLKNTIATAGQMSERLRQDAEREAKLIIADSNQKGEMIVKDARESMRKMYQEISDLKRSRLQFEANLKSMVQAHLSLLEQGEKFLPHLNLPGMSQNFQDSGSTPSNQPNSKAEVKAKSSQISPLSLERN